MIGWLQGFVLLKNADSLIVNVSGVGYDVYTHPRLLASLAIGDAVTLTIETHVREDHIHLFGFAAHAEREWFRALTSVERVGAKVALAILGTLTPEQMLTAILAKDTRAFTQISGVGAKMGERLVMELKDKALKLPIDSFPGDSPALLAVPITPAASNGAGKNKQSTAASTSSTASLIQDATSALTNLGYNRSEALTWVTQSLQREPVTDLDTLITLSLRSAS